MNISFSITDAEADIIAKQYAYDVSKGARDDFVLELFKEFGRRVILSELDREAEVIKQQEKQASLDSSKSQISF